MQREFLAKILYTRKTDKSDITTKLVNVNAQTTEEAVRKVKLLDGCEKVLKVYGEMRYGL